MSTPAVHSLLTKSNNLEHWETIKLYISAYWEVTAFFTCGMALFPLVLDWLGIADFNLIGDKYRPSQIKSKLKTLLNEIKKAA